MLSGLVNSRPIFLSLLLRDVVANGHFAHRVEQVKSCYGLSRNGFNFNNLVRTCLGWVKDTKRGMACQQKSKQDMGSGKGGTSLYFYGGPHVSGPGSSPPAASGVSLKRKKSLPNWRRVSNFRLDTIPSNPKNAHKSLHEEV